MRHQTEIANKLQEPMYEWGDLILKPEIEEDLNSIWLAIQYDDHGDCFWLIGRTDGTFYKYSYFINRTIDFVLDKDWERKPIMWKKPDERAVISNGLFFKFRQEFEALDEESGYFKHYLNKPRKEYSANAAQNKFDLFLNYVNAIVKGDRMVHECHGIFGYSKESLRAYLKVNGIDTPENLKKLEEQPFDTRTDGFDGISGKIKHESNYIWFDNILYAYVNGRDIPIESIPSYPTYEDEWGCETYMLNLNSYRPSKKYSA